VSIVIFFSITKQCIFCFTDSTVFYFCENFLSAIFVFAVNFFYVSCNQLLAVSLVFMSFAGPQQISAVESLSVPHHPHLLLHSPGYILFYKYSARRFFPREHELIKNKICTTDDCVRRRSDTVGFCFILFTTKPIRSCIILM
jgi:hypothetical protein